MLGSRYNRFKRAGRSNHGEQTQDVFEGLMSGESGGSTRPKLSYELGEVPMNTSQHDLEEQLDHPGHPSGTAKFADSSTRPGLFLARRKFPSSRRYATMRPRSGSRTIYLLKLILMIIGLLQCLVVVCNAIDALVPDFIDLVAGPIKDFNAYSSLPSHWSETLTADVHPIMCHSHNDYRRREPLSSAIRAGCTGVEADVWHFDGKLYVAHHIAGIRQNRTLSSLYLDPLANILDHQNVVPEFMEPVTTVRNGVFAGHPRQSLVLLIDFKNDPEQTWDILSSHLDDFRQKDFLTYARASSIINRPLTIVVSGDAPFPRIIENSTHRDIFYDAPLDLMASISPSVLPLDTVAEPPPHTDVLADPKSFPADPTIYSPTNSYYASVSFIKSIGYPWHSSLSQTQLNLLRKQIRGAHARGLKVRYWGIPAWPVGVRNYIWRVLVREGVDYLSVDDIEAVTHDNWGPRKGGWGKKFWR
ncbi:hypothetical protein PV11_08241 [Exophiala sideris]|uniref:Altered inheritance of mitochondria protein 6 n=1 Tax=Exophiala sideris TaxID=1016849 RepID=A0A0D1Z1J1_9EURO|nr:hypothetical protein PV11_08241 [Exophiala sideris]